MFYFFLFITTFNLSFFLIFKKEIYATACIIGGVVYFVLDRFGVPNEWLIAVSILTVIAIRLVAVAFKISLPTLYKEN